LLTGHVTIAGASCVASSEFTTPGYGYVCENALDGSPSSWASDYQGVGAWINVTWSSAAYITHLELKERCSDLGTMAKFVDVRFDDSSTQAVVYKLLLSKYTKYYFSMISIGTYS
jgi:hypothetical protein